jgi:DNA-binding NarL/FixJ family response regulator
MSRPASALIIDDEAHVRVLLTAILKQLGVRTIWEAEDGVSGIERVALQKPDFVLLDLNLPQMSGLEVLEKLKAANPAIPVIVVSAQSTVRTVNRVKELGATGYVVKYSPKAELTQMISNLLDGISESPSEDVSKDGAKPPASS